MDRLNQIRGEAERSKDFTLDTSSPPSEAYITANESSSKFFSLSEVDSTFSVSPTKDGNPAPANIERTITDTDLISNLSPIPKPNDLGSFKIGKQIEAANILSGGVNIFDDNSYDGDELVIDDNVPIEDGKSTPELKADDVNQVISIDKADEMLETAGIAEAIGNKDTEVVLQIDGKNVDAIDIGNGLYLYRRPGEEELAAVQIIEDNQQQPSFKFLKVRENAEGNLEVYEEIEIEVPKDMPIQPDEVKQDPKKNVNDDSPIDSSDRTIEKGNTQKNIEADDTSIESNRDLKEESELNLNGKAMKFSESRKSPVISTFKPMTYHSTPNKEGKPLTKTMVDQQLQPSRHSDNIKKTIEVHTESCKQKSVESPIKNKEQKDNQIDDVECSEKDLSSEKISENIQTEDRVEQDSSEIKVCDNKLGKNNESECVNLDKNDSNLSSENNLIDKKVSVIENQVETIKLENQTLPNEKHINSEQDNITTEKTSALGSVAKVFIKSDDPVDLIATSEDSETVDENKLVIVDDAVVIESDSDISNIPNTNNADAFVNSIAEEKEISSSDKADPTPAQTDNNSKPDLENQESIATPDDHDSQLGNATIIKEASNNESSKSDLITSDLSKSNLEAEGCKLKDDANVPACEVSTDVETNKDDLKTKEKHDLKESVCETPPCELSTKSNVNDDQKQKDIKLDNNETVPNEKAEKEIVIASSEGSLEKGDTKAEEVIENKSTKVECDSLIKDKTENSVNSNKDGVKSNIKCENIVNQKNSDVQKIKFLKESSEKSEDLLNKPILALPKESKVESFIETKACNSIAKPVPIKGDQTVAETKKDIKKEIGKLPPSQDKPVNKKNSVAVPFGKWTEANRQEFLNKIKESKVTTNNSNAKQIKQPNDLNRRDVLKKIDSQRQSNNTILMKHQDSKATNKTKSNEITFKNKPNPESMANFAASKLVPKVACDSSKDTVKSKTTSEVVQSVNAVDISTNNQLGQRKEINNQDLIDKTIEGIINRALPTKPDEQKPCMETSLNESDKNAYLETFNDIERKMNELHGSPYVDCAHESQPDSKSINVKDIKMSNLNSTDKIQILPPFTNKTQLSLIKDQDRVISDEDIIEHVPITGDMKISKNNIVNNESIANTNSDVGAKKEQIITEKEFDKFARRNSVTYENCLTVNLDRKDPHNVIKSIVPKEVPGKKLSRNELMLAESKAKSNTNKQNAARHHNHHTSKIPTAVKSSNNDNYSKNYPSKVQIAYQSALTAKRQYEVPIPIIEDKPVKVVFMDSSSDFVPILNVQGKELSPTKTQANDSDKFVHSASESMDSDILDNLDNKQDDSKSKIKHQRKQVLTPVETPELELIDPTDLDMETSPKKKRRLDDKSEKRTKTLVPKKSYLLNRNIEEKKEIIKDSNEIVNRSEPYVVHPDPISAIDNLVKAAELLETQSENKILNNTSDDNSQQSTPVKRGRGRPRKYPLPGTEPNTKPPSPQKKPRLQEEKVYKEHTESEESSDEGMIKENWTLGKINENVVCPICNKLFRSENVVFKHVKHCTGPSPNRSESDKRSSSRLRRSQESKRSSTDSKSDDLDFDEDVIILNKRKSRELKTAKDKHELDDEQNDRRPETSEQILRNKIKTQNLICELCGKSFRQLSYLLSHKLQHKSEDSKKDNSSEISKNIFSCEVCKKEFRKLHHLVQHRLIHKPNATSSRLSRKSSSELRESKIEKDNRVESQKQAEDHSAGFRCEPCDKSFRKLHHLVEHRETHDGINKKCPPQTAIETVKPTLHQCDICKKTFKKLQHLMEHKDQHLDTGSEKSDDKSVQSSLSTRDIIHECSLCYMVFPNEHSLNKHTVICLRKKKQSASKAKQKEENVVSIDDDDDDDDEDEDDDNKDDLDDESDVQIINDIMEPVPRREIKTEVVDANEQKEIPKEVLVTTKPAEPVTNNEDSDSKSDDLPLISTKNVNIVDQPKKLEEVKPTSPKSIETIVIPETPTPKKRTAIKDRSATVNKKQKTVNVTMPVVEDTKPAGESSEDDDEVRYMLNPDVKPDETIEEKFMKVRANKRNSLQIERPNSKDLVIRRISLQHPPKIPRLKAKPIEVKGQPATSVKQTKVTIDAVASTDSDDSDVKYSFPKTAVAKHTPKKVEKLNRKLIGDKRKSLTSMAKRKSLGKQKAITSVKKVRKRAEVEHRCDCGQLFSSAALLARHTTLAHTPPRIRRRRSPPPDTKTIKPTVKNIKTNTKTTLPPANQPKTPKANKQTTKPKMIAKNKPQITNKQPSPGRSKQNVTNKNSKVGVATRKSSVSNSDAKSSSDAVKSANSDNNGKVRRSIAHKGVPVPEKMRKLMEKSKL